MWEVTMGVGTFLLIILTAILAGAIGMIIMLAIACNH
jgi:hypothetical protein